MLRSHSALSSAVRCLCGVSLFTLLPATAAFAQDGGTATSSARDFDIPAGTLDDALRLFARQSGVQVSWSGIDGTAIRTATVRGRLPAASALSRLLEGTGLTYRFTAPTSAILERAPQATAGTIQLGTLRVEGAAGGGSALPRAGGIPDFAPADRNFRGAQSTAYRGQEQIERFRGTSPGDFLSGIPGVLNGDNRNSGALDVNIRGMQGMDRVPVVIDGSLQQSTVYRGYSGVAGRTYLDPDLIGEVTIEKGPSAPADGVGATGGLVRVETVGAKDLIAPGGTFGIQLRGGLTGNNVDPPATATLGTGNGTRERFDRPGLLELNGFNLSVAAAGRVGDFELVGAVARRKTGNYFGGEHGTVPPGGISVTGGVLHRYNLGEEALSTSQDNTSMLLRGVWRFGDGMGLDLSYMRYESDFGEMMPSQILRFGGAMQAPLSRTEVDTYTARFRWDPADNDLVNFKADLWATSNFTSIETLYRYMFPDGTVRIDDAAYQSQSDRWGVNLSNLSAIEGGFGRVELNYGASYTRERLTPPKGWKDYKSNSGYTAFVEPRDGWRDEYSAFIAAQWKPNAWVTFDAALRYTNTESHDNNLVDISTGSGTRATGYNHEKNAGLAPILALLIEPLSGLQFYARYAEAIRNPSLFESTTGFSFFPDPRNPVRPERARTTELGINLQQASLIARDDLLQAKLAYFTNDIDDYLTRGISDGLTSVVNIESARFQGIEGSLRYDSGGFFLDAGATWYTFREFCAMDGLCREGGTVNSYVPAHLTPKFSATVNAGVRAFDERLELGARYTHVGSRDAPVITWGGSLSTVEWTPYDLFDLYGSFVIAPQLKLNLAVDNLTDRYYMDALTLGLMPSPGRTVRLGITAGFGGPKRTRSAEARHMAAGALEANSILPEFNGDWSGPYAGLQAGHAFLGTRGATTAGNGTAGGIPATESARTRLNGATAGAFAGYNWQTNGALVFGVEGDFDLTRASKRQYAVSTELLIPYSCRTLGVCDIRNQADTHYDFDWMASLRGRIGYATGRALLFVTGGLALLKENQTRTQYRDLADPQNIRPNNPYGSTSAATFSETDSATRKGWTAGAGMEIALGDSWSLRGSYSYSRFGESEFRFDDARAGVGIPQILRQYIYTDPVTGLPAINPATGTLWAYEKRPGTYDSVNGRRARNSAEFHAIRLGIGFRF
jgi:hemoglobin/transferrin/lactoferrin receptor protein